LGLAGCGFQPVYGPGGERNAVTGAGMRDELAAVRVSPIGERNGQLLRRALQRQLEGLRPGTQARYDLRATLSYQAEGEGYRRDGVITRVRYVATATWILSTAALPPVVVERGTVRTLDTYNIPDLQFFASDSSRDDMERRLVAEMSDRIVIAVAAVLRRRMQG
jgi:LPS-assembly lipoprotein